MALWFALAIAFLNVGFFTFFDRHPTPIRLSAAVAAAVLVVWWYVGYRRGGFPTIGWIVEAVLITAVTAFSPMPLRAIGVFYAGIQFRALYVPRKELLLLPLSYAFARVASIAMSPDQASFGALSAMSFVQIAGLTVIGVTLHLFMDSIHRQGDTERALKRSDERYQLVASVTRDVVYDWNVVTGAVEWTESMQTVFGFAPHDVGRDITWWFDRVHPADRDALQGAGVAALGDPTVSLQTMRHRVRRADDTYAHISGTMLIQRNEHGVAVRVIGSIRDITSEQQLEEQLRQAQKMEAVGQLAGGVAHDFNNLLTVIGGHVFMLEQQLPHGEQTTKHLGGITRAADRAASLTKQLLAFSRKQILTPSVVDINAVVDDMIEMMRPVIGEHVEVVTRLDPILSPVFADEGQVSQVLVNLALNARDAMAAGGTLTIETANTTISAYRDSSTITTLPAGEYVRLSVTDTGTGMHAETLARAFEPFFTTKPHGKGTGLGLATVYGIVKQSFGDIIATSTPGAGSTFTVFLPVAARPAAAGVRAPTPPFGTARAIRPQSILLVEDNDGVRDFAHAVLSSAGYRVRPARNGGDALAQLRMDSEVDVIVTDVVMPEMGGFELVEELRRTRGDIPVLYISGFSDDPRINAQVQGPWSRFLEKPFTASALEIAVSEVSHLSVGRPESPVQAL